MVGVNIKNPTASNLITYTPATGGGLTNLISAQYIKGANYYEYFLIYETDFSASSRIEQAPGDTGTTVKNITVINQNVNSQYNNISATIALGTLRLFFTPDPGAPRTFFVRVVVQ